MSNQGNALDAVKLPEIISSIGSPFGDGLVFDENFFDSGYEIQVVSGMDKGLSFPLDSKEIILGRKERADESKPGYILFFDSTVSKEHASLRWDDDLEKYVIYHLSSESPTIVNGRSVKKSLLSPDYTVQLGKTIFTLVSIKDKRRKESTMMWDQFKSGEKRGEVELETGYKLVIVEGPDKGESFDLDKNLMIIGRRKGPADMRDTYGILLSDPTLPEELALLVWNDKECKFGIFQSEESPVPLRLFRVVETVEGSRIVGREYQNILEDKDSILAGETVMVVHKTTINETPEASVDIEKELRVEMPAVEEPEEIISMTAAGTFRVDYVFEVIEGKDTGNRISLLADEMTEGRIVTFGSKGEARQNDVEIDDPAISNTHGYFELSGGNLYLINESDRSEIMVNNYVIGENEKIVLNSGDRIRMGDSVLSFTDNRIIAALKNFSLIVAQGLEKDKGARFPISKTMFFIGRGSACDVRVHDPEVSRLHCVMSFKAGRFHIEHKSKINPTFVNGVSLRKGQERIIFPGDKLYLSGNTVLQLVRTGD